ncbi:hypothetical protein P4O66_017070 [Electrophorus voltai]|uniref:Uncharacterized protein n=1 Tax=Electrophorus voltai TaxID=2609070 RepID=A0AAD8YU28_9TELE|nr:hypothetical protein P4O66_017070 [Electrophorus voltai]
MSRVSSLCRADPRDPSALQHTMVSSPSACAGVPQMFPPAAEGSGCLPRAYPAPVPLWQEGDRKRRSVARLASLSHSPGETQGPREAVWKGLLHLGFKA